MIRLCFVCLGNICRSPTAEGVMLHLLRQEGLQSQVQVESAGTAAYHCGERADSRSRAAARQRGVELPSRACQFQASDFDRFDYVLCMDSSNLQNLAAQAKGNQRQKLHLLLDFDPNSPKGRNVPDPYYGGQHGFEEVLDLCFSACHHLLQFIKQHHLVNQD